ncbi:hypothetical protein BEWA_003070 [Theileria equi strain WA]|uniref:Uncharacterized protein n=1 Tax=Theileria equi strain WA TaxID=1537102 RepID=L0B1C2_THEEQ|nr:hypothetical protein BEWA_003070 [Theileria equi strain WA]AFZ80899.1 hypothetical protein BEWA_003070 [Theileria equi strain WA]|eukprot:XP_004830565.1 hypothetical protein BEWA_003070 [Theileria equi strain WA]
MESKYLTADISHKPRAQEATIYQDGTRWYAYFDAEFPKDPITTIEYFQLPWLPGYKKIVHNANGQSKFKDMKFKGTSIELIHAHYISTISVYYWNGDTGYDHPLIIQVGEGSYYAKENGDSHWSLLGKMDNHALLMKLDELNCGANDAHIVDICQVSGNYMCQSCNNVQISLTCDVFRVACSEFCMYTHHVKNGHVGRTIEGHVSLLGLEASKNDSSLYVFCYKGFKLLISMQLFSILTYEFFTRNAVYGETWTKMTSLSPKNPYDIYKILDTLKRVAGESDDAHSRMKRFGISALIGAGLACIIMTLYYLIPVKKAGVVIESVKYMLKPKEVKYLTME